MKFLNLNTGYTFDAAWQNYMPWSDWVVERFSLADKNNYIGNDYKEVMFSDVYSDDTPATEGTTLWYHADDVIISNVKRVAIRTRVPQQSKGYIFWFPNEQSVGITYTMPICVITDSGDRLQISVENNDVFYLIDGNTDIDTLQDGEKIVIDDHVFGKPIKRMDKLTDPQPIGDKYAHIFTVACYGTTVGEYVCKISIGDNQYIRVGADLYGEYEPTYINLSNMGIELPDMFQKAIYDVDVHEDAKDNITINRKLKELLSNYWDIVANKGSYKSLINALQWFEWTDVLKVKEIWKHYSAGRVVFDDRDIMSLFESKINDSFANFVKTTYVSLYCSLQEELPTYDNEMNPEIADVVLKWSKEDIRLKISLLAQFFSIYFMPIHMSVLHATAEDLVFTNTIKAIHSADVKRNDSFGDFSNVECNIKNGDVYKITSAKVQATADTMFVWSCNVDEHQDSICNHIFGVDKFPSNFPSNDALAKESITTFAKNYYVGPGVIIPFELKLTNQTNKDFIKQTIIDYSVDGVDYPRNYFYNIFYAKKNSISIKFNTVAKFAGEYVVRFTFLMASGKTITKRIEFKVEDTTNVNINVYRICAKDDSKRDGFDGFSYADFKSGGCNKYMFKIQNKPTSTKDHIIKHQYLPYLPQNLLNDPKYKDYKGIKLNRTVVFDMNPEYTDDTYITELRSIMSKDYLEFTRHSDNGKGELTYLVYVSKYFYSELPSELDLDKVHMIRNDLGFYPQFHIPKKIEGNNINDYILSQYDAICCAAEFNDGKTVEEFNYGNALKGTEWVFNNVSTGDTMEYLGTSSRAPFIASHNKQLLDQGYYGISFTYSLSNNTEHTCSINSAFIIKHI